MGVEARVVDDHGVTLPNDGVSMGELEVRGPWVTGSYYRDEWRRGWMKVGSGPEISRGSTAATNITLTNRAKDVIKSGGEWISSVELELLIASHPDVADATVIGVAYTKWQERPLAVVVARVATW